MIESTIQLINSVSVLNLFSFFKRGKLIVFLDIKGVILDKWFPHGTTMNQHYYEQVLEAVRKGHKKVAMIMGKWFHPSLGKYITLFEHPPCPLDIVAPRDFFLF